MAFSTDEKRQCIACLETIPLLATKCKFCGTTQPDAVTARLQLRLLREAADDGTEDQQEAYRQYKLEIAHLPRWLRRTLKTVNFLRENRRAHNAIAFAGGLVSFIMLYWLAGLGNEAAGQYFDPDGFFFRALAIALGLGAFAYGSTHIFRAFYVIVEAINKVLSDEKENRIRRGEAAIKASKFLEKQNQSKSDPGISPAAAPTVRPGFKTLAELDAERNEP